MRILAVLALMLLLTGCPGTCPTLHEQLPFNVDPSLMTPPEKLHTL